MVILLALPSEPFWPSACPERVGKLVDGENAFSVEFLALLRGHIRQQAEIICQVAAGFQAAVRMLYDFLVVRQITRSNPAHSVRGPKYVVKKGKTPVWSREDAKTLLDSIPKNSVSGLRDLALIAAMFYSFARLSAVLQCCSKACLK